MASTTFLRLLPLLSTTASMTHAYMELITMSSFYRSPPTNSLITRTALSSPSSKALPTPDAETTKQMKEEEEQAADVTIPRWFATWFNIAVISVIALNNVTLFSALANLFLFPVQGEARKFYLWGLGAAVGHFAFVPGVEPSIKKMFRMCMDRGSGDGKKEKAGEAKRVAREWIGVHRVRMATVDLAAWACFGIGAVVVLS